MTTKRLALLFAVVALGLGSIFLLPKQLGFQPTGVQMELPKMIGGWYGQDVAVSPKEVQVLGKGTEFARKTYRNGRGYEITASIVLSGQDMNTSIHRPERCMPAQGFNVIDKTSSAILLADSGLLKPTRLKNVRNVTTDDNKPLSLYSVVYYWFVGHEDTTGSHFARTWMDVRDRLVHGYNQRWAYVTVSAILPPGSEQDPRVEQVVDEWMQDFIKQLLPKIQKTEKAGAIATL